MFFLFVCLCTNVPPSVDTSQKTIFWLCALNKPLKPCDLLGRHPTTPFIRDGMMNRIPFTTIKLHVTTGPSNKSMFVCELFL